jgi:hypothetical protein
MSQSYQSILDHHIAEKLRFVSNTQSFWCTLDTSYPWLPPCQPNPFGAERLRGCVASRRAALVSSRRASWLLHCLLSSPHCASLSSSCRASWLLHRLSPSSHCAALSSYCLASWLSPCLSPSSRCATLSSTHHASLLSRRPSSSSHCARRRPLVLSSCRLVVTSPLNAPPSCRLVVSLCRLSLSCCASWLSRHHLLSSSRCTAGAGNGGRSGGSAMAPDKNQPKSGSKDV